MVSARTAAVAVAAVVAGAALLAAFAVQQGCSASAAIPVVVPSDVHVAQAGGDAPAAAPAPPFRGRGDIEPAGDVRLEAARTVALYCHLIDAGQFARAGGLCTRRRLWSRGAFGAPTRFRFRSARVYAAPDARTLVLKARVRVRAGRGRPLPDGLAVLFFTLGRAGSAAGGWLITAVSSSP